VEQTLHLVAQYLALVLEALALLVIAIGAVEAAVGIGRAMVNRTSQPARRAIWLGFAHWLIAGLTFQLAADIAHTTIAPSWDDIGRVAAIAAIRTFLTFFLDRDIENEYRRERQSDARPG
jgi:uncharacterized membrane protein